MNGRGSSEASSDARTPPEPKITSRSLSVDTPDKDKVDTNLRSVANEVRAPQNADFDKQKDDMMSTHPREILQMTPDESPEHQDKRSLLDDVSKVSDDSHSPTLTGGKGSFTQWVHGGFIVGSETICPPNIHWVQGEYF